MEKNRDALEITGLTSSRCFSPLNPSVLVVDDSQISLTYFTIMLDESVNVLTAKNAKEALDILQGEHHISVILLDLMLPDLNGLEVLRKIRNSEKTADIPVIVITGSNNNEWMLRSANMDIQGYFKKPFDGAALNARIMDLSGNARVSSYKALRELWGDDYDMRMQNAGMIVKPALAYINENFHKICRRDNLAAHLGVSSDYLSRVFKKEVGLCLNEYITYCRIDLSQGLLINQPKMKVKSIASYVGLSDVDYFFKVFKKHCGCTPKEYRQKSIHTD